jgi:hypothetical protein
MQAHRTTFETTRRTTRATKLSNHPHKIASQTTTEGGSFPPLAKPDDIAKHGYPPDKEATATANTLDTPSHNLTGLVRSTKLLEFFPTLRPRPYQKPSARSHPPKPLQHTSTQPAPEMAPTHPTASSNVHPPSPSPLRTATALHTVKSLRIPRKLGLMDVPSSTSHALPTDDPPATSRDGNDPPSPNLGRDPPPLNSMPHHAMDANLSSFFSPTGNESMNYDDADNSGQASPPHTNVYGPLTRFVPPPTNSTPQPTVPNMATTPLQLPTARVQGWDTDNVLLNLDPNQIILWNETAEPKILVYTWEPTYRPGQIDLVHTLHKAIASAISILEPDVGPPQAAHPPRQRCQTADADLDIFMILISHLLYLFPRLLEALYWGS